MRRFYAYIRVSTTRQGELGVSLDQQKAAIQAYAERNELDLVRWFEEQETAAKRGRPVFGEMLRLLKAGRAAGVVIHKIDRSARNLRDWADLGELIDQGISVCFANEALDLSSRGGRLAADIQAIISADFIRNLREETKKGFYGRLKQGLFPRPAPVGYLNCGKGKPKILDPEKAHFIRTAFELYASGRFSLKTLTGEMYSLGLRGRAGQRISQNGMSKILNNRFYTGTIEVKKNSETYAGIHEAIITQAQFDRVQMMLQCKSGSKLVKHNLLFRKMFRCQHCQFHLVGERHKGIVYYRCHTPGCSNRSVRESKLEQAILRKLKHLEFTQEEKNYFRQRVLQLRRDWNSHLDQNLESLKLHVKRVEERLEKLTDAYLDQTIDRESFVRCKTTLLEERRSAQDQLAESARNPVRIADQLQSFLERAGNAYLTYKLGTEDEKRELVNILTSNRYVDGKSPKIMLDFPFNLIADRLSVPGGRASRGIPRTFDRLIHKILEFVKTSVSSNSEEIHAM